MNKIRGKENILLLMFLVLAFVYSATAQKNNQTKSPSNKEKIRQLNDFIKKSFSENYKSQDDSKSTNLDTKKETPTTMKYEGRLVNFKGCNISFYSGTKVELPKTYFYENVSFSLKDIDLEKTYVSNNSYFPDKNNAITLHFRTKKNQIRSQGQSLSTASGPNTDRYVPLNKIMSQYFVTLRTSASLQEIRDALRDAVEICQKD